MISATDSVKIVHLWYLQSINLVPKIKAEQNRISFTRLLSERVQKGRKWAVSHISIYFSLLFFLQVDLKRGSSSHQTCLKSFKNKNSINKKSAVFVTKLIINYKIIDLIEDWGKFILILIVISYTYNNYFIRTEMLKMQMANLQPWKISWKVLHNKKLIMISKFQLLCLSCTVSPILHYDTHSINGILFLMKFKK